MSNTREHTRCLGGKKCTRGGRISEGQQAAKSFMLSQHVECRLYFGVRFKIISPFVCIILIVNIHKWRIRKRVNIVMAKVRSRMSSYDKYAEQPY